MQLEQGTGRWMPPRTDHSPAPPAACPPSSLDEAAPGAVSISRLELQREPGALLLEGAEAT